MQSIAPAVAEHLLSRAIPFDVIEHPRSENALESARSAHLSPVQVAKAVMVKTRGIKKLSRLSQYRLCVIPASNRLVMDWLEETYSSDFELLSESELQSVFSDCECGAIPVLGQVYGVPVVWDKELSKAEHIYFEAGDHRHLIHLTHSAFMEALGLQERSHISCTSERYEFYRQLH